MSLSNVHRREKRADWGAGYETFAQKFVRFEELGCSPLKTNLPVDKLRLEQLFKENARWHKACKDAFNNTKLRRAEKRKYNEVAASNQTSPVKRRRVSLSAATTSSQPKCFFCDETSGELHKASTFSFDERVRKCAVLLQDNKLIAKLSCGGLITQDAMYHAKCLATLYKSASKVNGEDQSISGNEKILHGLVLAELVSYIVSKSQDYNESKPTVFKLADLVKI